MTLSNTIFNNSTLNSLLLKFCGVFMYTAYYSQTFIWNDFNPFTSRIHFTPFTDRVVISLTHPPTHMLVEIIHSDLSSLFLKS